MIELTFLKELILIKQLHQKGVIFVTTGIFLIKGFKFQLNVCYQFHDLLIMSIKLNNIAILNIKIPDCCCIISGIRKSEAIKLMQDLTQKSGNINTKSNFESINFLKKMENY